MFARSQLSTGFALIVILGVVNHVEGHGRLIDPPGRSTMWRYPDNPFIKPYVSEIEKNFQDNELFCGGFQHQQVQNGGKCGICGDPFDGERENEAGGKYAKGIIVAQYAVGDTITVRVEITASHKGYFEFRLCPMNDPTKAATKECLDEHLLEISDGQTRWLMPPDAMSNQIYEIRVNLPKNLDCTQCVFQWRYHTGNSWGCNNADDTECCVGCGPQEEFYGCADIAIGEDMVTPSLTSPVLSTTTTLHKTSSTKGSTLKTTTTSEPDGGDYECINGEYFPIDGECNRYYRCVYSELIIQECPAGTVVSVGEPFHCDYPFAVSPPCGTKE